MHDRLAEQAKRWDEIVKIGRTHLQDATPLTLGQEFSGYAAQIADNIDARRAGCCRGCIALAQGGTAVGTGLNAPKGFAEAFAAGGRESDAAAVRQRAEQVRRAGGARHAGRAVGRAQHARGVADQDRQRHPPARLAARAAASASCKLPENEPGSSIMPGKVNPTQAEMLTMVAAQVMGNHVAVTVGGLQGHLELNVFKPLIGANVLRSIDLLAIGMESFAERTLDGLEADERADRRADRPVADAGDRAGARDRL